MINELTKRYPCLVFCKKEISETAELLFNCFSNGGKLLLCGNGGSASDCSHISGELLKGFLKSRSLSDEQKENMKRLCPDIGDITEKLQGGLPAIPLPSLNSLNSAFSNDADSSLVYAQGVFALGKKEDVLLCISTSGNAENVVAAAKTAKALGISVVGLTGKNGGKLKKYCNTCICVPEEETFKIQELHLPVYHLLCAVTEEKFFKK